MRQAAGSSTRVIDLNGAFVSPGFNDGHVHVESTGALLTGANLLDVHEAKTFRERIARGSVAAAGGQLDHARRLGRVRAVGTGQRGRTCSSGREQARAAVLSCPIGSSSTT